MSDDLRIGVYVCWCGSNIAKMVDVQAISKEMAKLPDVVVSRDYKYMCSDPGQDLIKKDIEEHKLNRIVVASCSPRMHEITFQKVLEKAGVNPYLFEMANIREHCSWVHTDKKIATDKARSLIKAAIDRVRHHLPLEKREVGIDPATLVIGGGVAGLTAALEIANAGKQVYLVEKQSSLGGNVAQFDLTYPYLDSAKGILRAKINNVENNEKIKIFLNAQVTEVSGFVGSFEIKIKQQNKEHKVKVGNIIVATGFKPFDAAKIEQYGYGKLPNVITSVELEKLLADGNLAQTYANVKNIAVINCVGSRNPNYHDFCSRTCCLTALKQASQLKDIYPKANVFVAYTDMRAFGKGCEEFYERVCRQDVRFLMFDKSTLPKVRKGESRDKALLVVEMLESLSNVQIDIPADLVVLSVGMEAREDADEVAHLVGISQGKDGWFIEKHPKLDPVATTTDGVFIAGCCQGPKDIPDSVSQAYAAAARVLASIVKGKCAVEAITSVVDEDICAGCKTCIAVCPYGAVSFDEEKKVSVVNEVLCKGCGTCTSACPAGAITSRHFTREQILSQIEGLLSLKI